HVRVAAAGERAELRTDDVAAVGRQRLEDARVRLLLARRKRVELAVENALEPGELVELVDVRQLEAADETLAVEHGCVARAELPEGCGSRHGLLVEVATRLVEPGVGGDGRTLADVVAHPAAQRVQVVERPEVEEVDVVAAIHPRAGPDAEVLEAEI